MAEPKTIAEAINSVTDDDVDLEEGTEETTEETTDETTEEEDEGGSLLDEEDADEEGEEVEEEETARTGDVVGEEEEEEDTTAQPAAGDEPDVFDALTPEEIAAIKADPALNKLRKSLMRGYSAKTSEHNHLVQLGLAYKRDPKAVAQAIADSIGMRLAEKEAAAGAAAAAAAPAADPGSELEALFGPQIGPKVRAVFDKWVEARISPRVAPLEQTVGKVTAESENARMFGEEQAFKARHKDVTPEIEKEIVQLGSSGKIVPGDMTPAEYLETLYEVVMARRARQAAKSATKVAATKLARKIDGNRKDREPSGVSGRAGAVKKVSRIAEAKSISEALDLAMAELESER